MPGKIALNSIISYSLTAEVCQAYTWGYTLRGDIRIDDDEVYMRHSKAKKLGPSCWLLDKSITDTYL